MGVMIVMLIIALSPTGNFDWLNLSTPGVPADQLKPPPSSYAICFFGKNVPHDSQAYASMIISILLLLFGFLARIVRLHKTLSTGIIRGVRAWVSELATKRLKDIYGWCDIQHSPRSLKRLMVFRPLLAAFLLLRVCLDVWSSMFLEVSISLAMMAFCSRDI